MSDPHIKMAVVDLPGPLPEQGPQIATLAIKLIFQEMVHDKVHYQVLVTFKEGRAHIWQIHDMPQPEEMVRTLAKREQPEALAFIQSASPPPEVEADRGYTVDVESPQLSAGLYVALKAGENPDEQMVRLYVRDSVERERRWLGVEPRTEFELTLEGAVNPLGPTAEA